MRLYMSPPILNMSLVVELMGDHLFLAFPHSKGLTSLEMLYILCCQLLDHSLSVLQVKTLEDSSMLTKEETVLESEESGQDIAAEKKELSLQ
mmetsp:Transcript_44283/g.62166  ORF Transcript_44283/g.62166 Transcript_44283/m.62166 type:complete len:92 (+) Transcript_44283:518-793(+)